MKTLILTTQMNQPDFASRTTMKLHNIPSIPMMIRKVIVALGHVSEGI